MKRMFYVLSALLLTANLYAGYISGVVTNASNNTPVPFAQISVFLPASASGDSIVIHGQSDSTGIFNVMVPFNGFVTVSVSHPNFYTSAQGPVFVDSLTTLRLLFALQPRNSTGINLVSGNVKKAGTNLPVIGAKVLLTAPNTTGGSISTFTDAQGKYSFRNIVPGIYGLSVQKEGFVTYFHPQPLTITSTTIIENLNISLIPNNTTVNAIVNGGVYQFSPNPVWSPIGGAKIIFSSVNGSAVTTYSDSAGRYWIFNIPAGTYNVTCSREGYTTRTVNEFHLSPDTINILDFYLEPLLNTNFIKGQVKNAVTQLPLPGINVGLAPNNMLPVIYTAVTDNEGRYAFYNVPPGSYRMTAFGEGFIPYTRQELLTVTSKTQISNLNFLMMPVDTTLTSSVTGKVFAASSAGVAVPIEGAKITIVGPDSLIFTAFSNNLGEFLISNVPAGIYNAACSKEGYVTVTRYPYNVVPGVNILQFYLQPQGGNTYGTISGVVTIDGQNQPVANALIQFYSNNAPAVAPFAARTNANGAYHKELPAGAYYVSVLIESPDSMNLYREYYDNVQNITQATPVMVAAGVNTGNINFGVPGSPVSGFTFTVSGIVRTADNLPLQGANVKIISPVSAVPPTPAFGAITNGQGEYSMTVTINAPVNQYVFYVAASKEGYAVQFFDHKAALHLADLITVQNGSAVTNVNFDLSTGSSTGSYSISGNITKEDGTPVTGAFVLTSKAVSAGQMIVSLTDNSGNYTTQTLPPGKYYNLFLKEGYIPEFYNNAVRWENATPIMVSSSNVTGIDAALTGVTTTLSSGIFAGTVKDELGMPIAGAIVNMTGDNGVIRNYAVTDAEGYYSINGIGAGSYDISATQMGYTSAQQTVTYVPQNGTMHTVDFMLSQSPALGSDDNAEIIPSEYKLSNYPNPFNPSAKIDYQIPMLCKVQLKVYDILGYEVAVLVDENKPAGNYTVEFSAADLPSGIYFCELRTASQRIVNKMILMK